MIITCTQCDKKLTVRDELAGKKVRCPGCKGLIAVPKPSDDVTEIVAPVKPKRRTEAHTEDTVVDPAWAKKVAAKKAEAIEEDAPPKKKPVKAKLEDDEPDDDEGEDDEESADPTALRCAKCDSAAIKKLPPNAFSRNPGFVCTKCKAMMRPPGSTAVCLFAMVMGVFLVLFGVSVALLIVGGLLAGENVRGKSIGGAGGLAALGATVGLWGLYQIRLPVPRNSPPFRWLLWIGVSLVILFFGSLILGGCLFGFAYFLHEM